jgi:hypothetical protein
VHHEEHAVYPDFLSENFRSKIDSLIHKNRAINVSYEHINIVEYGNVHIDTTVFYFYRLFSLEEVAERFIIESFQIGDEEVLFTLSTGCSIDPAMIRRQFEKYSDSTKTLKKLKSTETNLIDDLCYKVYVTCDSAWYEAVSGVQRRVQSSITFPK